MELEKIGTNLNTIRKARGLTIEKLAKAVNISYPAVSNHIKTGRMSLETLVRYAEALGCKIGDLTDGVEDPEVFNLKDDLSEKYPWNVAYAIMYCTPWDKPKKGSEEEREAKEKLYEVYLPGLMESMKTLSDREQKVLELRYLHGLNLEQCGYRFGVTRERIRQVEAKALRKMRHPSRSRMFLKASDDLLDRAWKEMEEASRIRLEAIRIREGAFDDLIREKKVEPVNTEIPIDELELSVRSWNCLRRAGVNYISDMDGWTQERLMRVRNLGRKSMMEIIDRLRERGIEVPVE